MNRSWVRFPQAAQKRPPLQGWTLSSMYEAWAECAGERAVGLGVPSCGRTWLRVPRAGLCTLPLSRLGCLVCPWAAARPPAVRAASFARRVGSLSGQALPPPTGIAAWPSGSLALVLVGFLGYRTKRVGFVVTFRLLVRKVGVVGGVSQLGGWTNRVASRVTFWLCCVGKLLL